MQTKKIYVNGEEERTMDAMERTMEFADRQGLSPKEALRLRLITEELLSLFSGITDNDFMAWFWIEGDSNECEFHLLGKTEMNAEIRQRLLASSSTGRNEAAVGIMGRIRDMVATALLNSRDDDTDSADPSVSDFYDAGMELSSPIEGMRIWKLTNYREAMRNAEDQDFLEDEEESADEWDELERSIIANIADDVHVGIQKDKVEIVVFKSFDR